MESTNAVSGHIRLISLYWCRRRRQKQFLVEKKPALLSAILLVMLFGMPFVISFLAFNQISGDVQSRGLRYLLLRTGRSSIYFGRFLGVALFFTRVMGFIIATIVLYLGLEVRIYPATPLLVWSAQGWPKSRSCAITPRTLAEGRSLEKHFLEVTRDTKDAPMG